LCLKLCPRGLEQRRVLRRPPLSTLCHVHFAPSPQDPGHIRTITGVAEALDAFLEAETQPPPSLEKRTRVKSLLSPMKWSSSAQAPTCNKRRASTSLPPPPNPGERARGRPPPPPRPARLAARITVSSKA
jgi:hypothetical protein